MSRRLIELARFTRDEHDELFRRGTPPALEDLVGWEFKGWNCSLLPKLGGFQKFVKGFYRRSGEGSDECEGFNTPVIQNGLDGEWLGLPADDEPRRFGFYRVERWGPRREPDALLLDYGVHPANPPLEVARLLRDLLVEIDGDHLLGRAHLALGRWLFAGYFLLERRRRHAYEGD